MNIMECSIIEIIVQLVVTQSNKKFLANLMSLLHADMNTEKITISSSKLYQ